MCVFYLKIYLYKRVGRHVLPINMNLDPANNYAPLSNEDGRSRAKHWCFTINHPTIQDVSMFKDIAILTTYYVYGEEVADSGTEHLQCYICFDKAVTLKSCKGYWPRAHFEVMRGTPIQASDYCKKDGKFVEHGLLPKAKNVAGGEATKAKWIEISTAATENNLQLIQSKHPKEFVSNYRSLKQISFDFQPPMPDLDGDLDNLWVYGESGVGKSKSVREQYGEDLYYKMCNKWWDNYEGEENVLIDDLDLTHSVIGHHIKIWADRYAFRAEVKNHSKMIRPKRIIITSQYHPNEIWTDQKLVDAITRRFKVKHMIKLPDVDPLISKKSKIPYTKDAYAYNVVPKKHDKAYMALDNQIQKKKLRLIGSKSSIQSKIDKPLVQVGPVLKYKTPELSKPSLDFTNLKNQSISIDSSSEEEFDSSLPDISYDEGSNHGEWDSYDMYEKFVNQKK